MSATPRPRLLYFNGPWDYLGERMKAAYLRPFERLLAQDFEVISVVGDCDFASEVNQHKPDLVLFHTGTECPTEQVPRITHTDAHPHIPRIGFHWRDPFTPTRAFAMERLREWRVDAIVTINRPTDSPAPYFRDTFYLPFWIDDAVFKDYGEQKFIPITLAGSGWTEQVIYGWRNEIAKELMPRFAVFHSPSGEVSNSRHQFVGENYARLLNRSYFSAGCGTLNRLLTLKLLEIPAARCCLITEETEVLKAIGFRDGENCVFATGGNVAEKVGALLNDPARLTAITDAGFRLVHERHTQRQRTFFRDWFALWKSKQPGQRIVQPDPFGALELVGENEATPATRFPTENPLIGKLHEGYHLLQAQQWTAAAERFEWIRGRIPYMAEANLGSALAHLKLGQADHAVSLLVHNYNFLTQVFRGKQPDPIDQAFLAMVAVQRGMGPKGIEIAAVGPHVRHPALNALRWIFAQSHPALVTRNEAFRIKKGDTSCNTDSVHILAEPSFDAWVQRLLGCAKPAPAALSAA